MIDLQQSLMMGHPPQPGLGKREGTKETDGTTPHLLVGCGMSEFEEIVEGHARLVDGQWSQVIGDQFQALLPT